MNKLQSILTNNCLMRQTKIRSLKQKAVLPNNKIIFSTKKICHDSFDGSAKILYSKIYGNYFFGGRFFNLSICLV